MVTMENPDVRIGLGHDTHRLVANRPLILGGVHVEHDRGLDGHSDADVLIHAVIDALLGAAGLGDIGEWFPNTDPEWHGADSAKMLSHVVAEIASKSWKIANLDCTIFAESPSMKDWKPLIRERLAGLLRLDQQSVNVKAKSGERVGPVGRKESMSASAAVLLVRAAPAVRHAV